MARFLREDAQFASLTASDVPAAASVPSFTQTGTFSAIIKAPLNQDYRVWERVTYSATITRMTTKTSTGSCATSLLVNTTTVGNLVFGSNTAQVSSTTTTPNTTTAGDVIVLRVGANTSAGDLSFTVDYIWTLQ